MQALPHQTETIVVYLDKRLFYTSSASRMLWYLPRAGFEEGGAILRVRKSSSDVILQILFSWVQLQTQM